MKLLVGCLALLACHDPKPPIAPAAPAPGPSRASAPPPAAALPPRDVSRPRPMGHVTGRIRDANGKPIVGAQGCATAERDLFGDLVCASTDAAGAYRLDLAAGVYTLDASAPKLVPAPVRHEGELGFLVTDGETVAASDATLDGGASEITGTIRDAAGAPIAGAIVKARAGWGRTPGAAIATTDAVGQYSLWTRGDARITAFAPGRFLASSTWLFAPATADLTLRRSGTVEGSVVDERGAPIAGIRVMAVMNGWPMQASTTDARGAFQIAGLGEQRYTTVVSDAKLYSLPTTSVAVTSGGTVRDERVVVVPARSVTGKVTTLETGAACPHAEVSLARGDDLVATSAFADDAGNVTFDSLAPGTYEVSFVDCPHHRRGRGYPDIVVGDTDVTGLAWQVSTGVTIQGRVRARGGKPAAGVFLVARKRGDRFEGNGAMSRADGTYTIEELSPGTYELDVANEAGALPAPIEVTVASKPVTKDVTIGAGSIVVGLVLDEKGAPASRIEVSLEGDDASKLGWRKKKTITAPDGTFEFPSLPPGRYTVIAGVPWVPAGTDKPFATIVASTKRPAKLPTIRLPARGAPIRGLVVDARGAPVAGAMVSTEGDVTYTAADGSFVIDEVPPTEQMVLANLYAQVYTVMKNVAPGANVKIALPDVASIAGTVRTADGKPVTDLRIEVSGLSQLTEHERDAAGRFLLRDLAPGEYTVTVRTPSGSGRAAVEVAAGENKRGVEIVVKARAPAP